MSNSGFSQQLFNLALVALVFKFLFQFAQPNAQSVETSARAYGVASGVTLATPRTQPWQSRSCRS